MVFCNIFVSYCCTVTCVCTRNHASVQIISFTSVKLQVHKWRLCDANAFHSVQFVIGGRVVRFGDEFSAFISNSLVGINSFCFRKRIEKCLDCCGFFSSNGFPDMSLFLFRNRLESENNFSNWTWHIIYAVLILTNCS